VRLSDPTPPSWIEAVLGDFDAFLLDHAACERKASASALAFVAHYPDRPDLVDRCIGLAREELEHFHRVYGKIAERGLRLAPDTRSEYAGRLSRHFRQGSDAYFLDRLLTAAVVEARGCERFGLVAAALPAGAMKDFYREIARSEVRHHELYRDLARIYFDDAAVEERLAEILEIESGVMRELPVRAALY
jgi:tRNA-(ms[2]io[6]A)-hydroxylase